MMENNLDHLCAQYGLDIAQTSDDEKLIQKALGVLQEDGVFAYAIYLESENEETFEHISDKTIELIDTVGIVEEANDSDFKTFIYKITQNLDDLLLTKDLIERMLIYSRYHAKSLGD